MNKKILYKAFFGLFAILYASTAFISFLHAIEFFSIGNVHWMSIVLSAVFEIGQMSVLMSLLISDNNKKLLPWVLMIIFTTVQVVSNVYSVTKFIMLSEVNYYIYLQKALQFAIQNVPEDMIITAIAWIIGGLLPICALLLTSMCASQIKIMEEKAGQESLDDSAVNNATDSVKESGDVVVHDNTEQPVEQNNIIDSDIELSQSNPIQEDDMMHNDMDEIIETEEPLSVMENEEIDVVPESDTTEESFGDKIGSLFKKHQVTPNNTATTNDNNSSHERGVYVAEPGYFREPYVKSHINKK